MGSPRKLRKKFSKPSHPWQKERILAEKELLNAYGLRRKYEIWKMNSVLKNFTRQAKNIVSGNKLQSEKEKNQLLTKLLSLGLINNNSKIEEVLSLTLKDVMERRLQTLVFRKGLARTTSQARQFIVHGHISLGDKKITSPSYLVPLDEEGIIQFAESSAIKDINHPERAIVKQEKGIKSQGKEGNKEGNKEDKKDKAEADIGKKPVKKGKTKGKEAKSKKQKSKE
ncbi:30S ribosomal protein S4 [Candidatus Woesearchaeota archaeon]|nr:30S ribosomal protein S4 [Candidatus Woesearchaeota archaeon]